MKSRVQPIIVSILISLIAMSAGCQSMKDVPLFNPQARVMNRIYSARELRTEINNTIVQLRDAGILKQSDIDAKYVPVMNASKALVDEAEALASTDPDAANGKLGAAKSLLTTLRDQLKRLKASG